MEILNKKILEAAEVIQKAGIRGKGDWMVVSPEFGKQLQEVLDEEQHKQRIKERRLKIEKLRSKI